MNSGQFPEQFSFLQSTCYCILLHSMCNAPRTIKLEENRATNVRMNRFRLQEPQVLRNISSRTSKVFRLHKSHLEATASTIRYSKQSWRLYLFLMKKGFFWVEPPLDDVRVGMTISSDNCATWFHFRETYINLLIFTANW